MELVPSVSGGDKYISDIVSELIDNVTDYFDNIAKCFVFSGDIPDKTPTDVILVRINKKNIRFIDNFGVFN